MRKSVVAIVAVLLLGARGAKGGASPASARALTPAAGLTVNLPLVARLIGAGPTLYISSVDVQNNWTAATQVDWYLRGVNLRTSAAINVSGSFSATGTLVAQGTGGAMRARLNAHFEDMIDALVQAGFLPATIESDGFIGSMLFIFNGFTRPGQGGANVRFVNSFGGGTVGQALKGHEITVAEPQQLVAVARDSRGKPGVAQLYANIFVNNLGITPGGVNAAGPVTVHIEAFANSTGLSTGTPIDAVIGLGQTVSVSDVLTALKVPPGEDTVLVFVTVTSGTSAIAGVFAQVDVTTRDGSTSDMSPVD